MGGAFIAMMFPTTLGGVAFDLDGVLTDTATAHYRAWKRLADTLSIPFDEHANEALKGIDRMGSLDRIIGDRPDFDSAARKRLANKKNQWYLEEVSRFGPNDLFPGAKAALLQCRDAGLKIALASASRNAPLLIERLSIADLFDVVIDPASVAHGKPAPDIFAAAATHFHIPSTEMLGVEDAPAGIAAIKAAGMVAIGIGDPMILNDADRVIPAICDFDLSDYMAR